jgi:hypothetical protein
MEQTLFEASGTTIGGAAVLPRADAQLANALCVMRQVRA